MGKRKDRATSTNIGDVVVRHRIRLKLTQAKLAARAGIDVRSLAAIEGHETKDPHASTVRILAKALRISADELLGMTA